MMPNSLLVARKVAHTMRYRRSNGTWRPAQVIAGGKTATPDLRLADGTTVLIAVRATGVAAGWKH